MSRDESCDCCCPCPCACHESHPAAATAGFAAAFEALAGEVFRNAVSKGWWDSPRSDGECIALMHSELSEGLEALRDPAKVRSTKIPDFLEIEEELADVIIRIADFANARGYRVGAAVLAKHEYNQSRPHRHGGKKF